MNPTFKQPSNRSSRFSREPQARVSRSSFPLNYSHKGTIKTTGLIVPVALKEIIPGETINLKPTIFVRMTTQFQPIMDNLYLDWFAFFVPNRLVWTNWPKLMGERLPDPDSSISFSVPQMNIIAALDADDLGSYFGLPQNEVGANDLDVSALPFRGYNLIYREWFRDQNLQDSPTVDLDDGPDLAADYVVLTRTKRHDYFTSAITSPQKGTAIDIPLGDKAPVLGIGTQDQAFALSSVTAYESNGASRAYTFAQNIQDDLAGNQAYLEGTAASSGYPTIYADLSNATAATVNQLIEAFQVQSLLQTDARSGTRYFEIIQAHYGVTDPSSLVPTRPEFLGGDSTPFQQGAVAQSTFQGTETFLDAKGALAANSTFVSTGKSIVKSFTEHGYFFILASIRADIHYMQGIDKHFLRKTRYDFYFPALAHLGEQAIQSQELYWSGEGSESADPPTSDFSIFGYQERWAEMRYWRSIVTGQLHSKEAAPLDYLHLAEKFNSRPTLSATFIQDSTPMNRVINVNAATATPAFRFDCFIKGSMVLPMPTRSVPGLRTHF